MSQDLNLTLKLRATDQGLVGTVRDAKDEVEKLDSNLDQAEKTTKGFSDQTTKAEKKTDGFAQSIKSGAASAAQWAAAIATATAALAGYVVVNNTEIIRQTDQYAESLGMSTQAMTEWEYAAQSVGMQKDQLQGAFQDISDKMAELAVAGGGSAIDAVENLNVQFDQLIKMSPDKQFLAIGQAIEGINQHQKVFFMESLASDSTRLLPLLRDNAAELKRLQLEAQVLGISISDIDAAKVTQAGIAMGRTKGLMKGLANEATVALAPILTGVSNALVDNAVKAGGFKQAMTNTVDSIINGIGFVLDVGQQYLIWGKQAQIGMMTLGQYGTDAMASIADTTASVINTTLYPFQKTISWIIEQVSALIEIGAQFGGPFADSFKAASDWLKTFSNDVDQFEVKTGDIVALNEGMQASLSEAAAELEKLLNSNAPSDDLKSWVKRLREEAQKAAEAQVELRQETAQTGVVVGQGVDVSPYEKLNKELEAELELIKLTDRERAIEINLRKLSSDATDKQKNKIIELTGQLFDYQEQQKQHNEQVQDDLITLDDLFVDAMERIDKTTADAWLNLSDGFDGVLDGMADSFKRLLAEMAHAAITRPIVMSIQSSVSGSGSGSASGGGLSPTSLLSSGNNWLSSTSISDGISGVFGTATGGAAGSAQTVGGVSNLGMGAAAIGGYAAGELLFDGKGYSSQGGSIGAMAGAQYLSAAGPWGMIAGALAGAILGSMFAESEPEFDFRTRDSKATDKRKFEDEESGVIAQSAFGELGFDAENTNQLKKTFDGFENASTFLNGLAALDNAVAALAQSDAELQSMIDIVQQVNIEADDPRGVLNQISDRYLAALSQTTSRLTDGLNAEMVTMTRQEFSAKDDAWVDHDFQQLVVNVENELLNEFLKLDAGKAIPAITSVIQMERIGDAIGGAVTDDLYKTIEQGINEGVDISELVSRLNNAMTALPSLSALNNSFDITAAGALEAAANIVDYAGGLQNLQVMQQQYYDRYFTESEKTATQQQQLSDIFAQWNSTLPTTHAEFRSLVEGLDLTTKHGQKAHVALMQVAPAFSDLAVKLESLESRYYELFATDAEKAADLQEQVNEAFAEWGAEVPQTMERFRNLRDSLKESGTEGEAAYLALLEVAPAFAELNGILQESQDSASALALRIHDALNPKTETDNQNDALSTLDISDLSIKAATEYLGSLGDEGLAALQNKLGLADDLFESSIDTILNAYTNLESETEKTVLASTDSARDLIDIRKDEIRAIGKSQTAINDRNAALEEEEQRLTRLGQIESGFAAVGKSFADVLEESISSRIAKIESDVVAAGGLGELINTEASAALTNVVSLQSSIRDAESLQSTISYGTGDAEAHWSNELMLSNHALKQFDKTIGRMQGWDQSDYDNQLEMINNKLASGVDDPILERLHTTFRDVLIDYKDNRAGQCLSR